MLCRNCEREISSENRNCPHCGTSHLRGAAAAPNVRNNALKIGAMGLGALAAIAAVAAMTSPKPAPSVRVATVATVSPAMAAALLQERYDGGRRDGLGRAVSGLVWKYVISTANIRNYPTAQGSDVVGVLRPGQRIRGIMYRGMVDGSTFWFKLADGRGYVSAVNLADDYSGGGTSLPPPVSRPRDNGRSCYVDTTSGNLRVRASPNGRIVGAMPSGTRVRSYGGTRDGYGNYWVRIESLDGRYQSGWVSGDYVIC